ncbi:MAG: hypothetical protein C5S43_05110 [Candidatus Methanocomedens sp.]|nr:MAG: hypothetical protein C5S43_05110 [ANME-2 cluster archaeon]
MLNNLVDIVRVQENRKENLVLPVMAVKLSW